MEKPLHKEIQKGAVAEERYQCNNVKFPVEKHDHGENRREGDHNDYDGEIEFVPRRQAHDADDHGQAVEEDGWMEPLEIRRNDVQNLHIMQRKGPNKSDDEESPNDVLSLEVGEILSRDHFPLLQILP